MTDKSDKAAARARAEAIRESIESLQPKGKKARKHERPSAEPESPLAFVNRRMSELDKD